MLESTIVKAIRDMLTGRGCWSVKFHGSAFTPKGNSDIYACCKGMFVAFEVKVPGNEPTRIQQKNARDIADAGGIAAIVHSVKEAEDVLNKANL